MFDDPKPKDLIQGHNGYCTIAEFNRMNKTEKDIFVYGYIKLDNCKNHHLYKIFSRNLGYGVFIEKSKGFVGIREKFGSRFLFEEYHFDTGEPFGTVHPLKEICKVPSDIVENVGNRWLSDNTQLFDWLEQKENQKNE